MTEIAEPVPATGMFENYRPIPGAFDELFDPSGKPREHSRRLIEELERLGPGEIDRGFKQASQLIRENGISFNAFDEAGESSRPWHLDIIPTIIARSDFLKLDEGLVQRATLLEAILDDVFGQQRLVREKVIPPALLFAHPGFHRCYHNLQAVGQRRLTVYAADLARSPNGNWWVTGDRTRSPSGLGFVLENRIITSRVLPGVFRATRACRLASFFGQLRETLRSSAGRYRENPRIVLLSHGPESATYFEDVYLARYLGYTLVEGGDLAVREGRVMLKTLGGLLPVEVILRRVSDDDCDPVELNPASLAGVSGLVDVVRSNEVVVANALGSRIAESPALAPFLRAACRLLLGSDLKLPSVATWWCGQPDALKYVIENIDKLIVRPAFLVRDVMPTETALLSKSARDEFIAQIRSRPEGFVAQERIVRSTVPVWLGSTAEPWHAGFRMFLTASGDSFQTLPGGLARVSPDHLSLDRLMAPGQRAQDVWIESQGPVESTSLLRSMDAPLTLVRSGNDLPSRDADNLFWLGRMVERADTSARVFRVLLQRVVGGEDDDTDVEHRALLRALAAMGQIEPAYAVKELDAGLPGLDHSLPAAAFSTIESRSLKSTVQEIVRLADTVRDRLSTDAWRSLSQLGSPWHPSDKRARTLDAAGLLPLVQKIINAAAHFSGLSNDGMTRTQVWRFLELGRRLERVWNLATLIQAALTTPLDSEGPVLEAVLEGCDSVLTYRTRYLGILQVEPVLDLLITDDTNPRSMVFQLDQIQNHVIRLPSAGQATLGPDERLAMSLYNSVRLAQPRELTRIENGERERLDRLMQRLIDQIPNLSSLISQRYLIHAGLPRQFGND